jgi:hypothetical protein
MLKAARARSAPRRTASKTQSTRQPAPSLAALQTTDQCPVLPIALRVGELWDAHAGAEKRERDERKADKAIAEQINEMLYAVENTASFEQARSLGGALFQVALAREEANVLNAMVPSEDQHSPTYMKLCRLLDSVAVALRDAMGPDYETVKDVVAVYLRIDDSDSSRSSRWLDEIPAMAEEWRSKAAETGNAGH